MASPVQTFTGADGDKWARVVDPNGHELTRTSEGYRHESDALHALIRSAALVGDALGPGGVTAGGLDVEHVEVDEAGDEVGEVAIEHGGESVAGE